LNSWGKNSFADPFPAFCYFDCRRPIHSKRPWIRSGNRIRSNS
jgi:hypothetical protein